MAFRASVRWSLFVSSLLLIVLLLRQRPSALPPATEAATTLSTTLLPTTAQPADAPRVAAEVSGELAFKPWWELAADESDGSGGVSRFAYAVHNTTFEGKTECTPRAADMVDGFDAAFEALKDRQARMLAGQIPPRFVHISIAWKSSLQNSMKVVASAVLLGMTLERGVLVSWNRHLDNESVYWERRAFDDLFEAPPFNWTYDIAKFSEPQWDRYDVHGYGLEEYVEQEPIHRLMCSDIRNDNTTWIELYWRYGFVGSLLWHSPYTHDIVSRWLARDDMFGPVARKLFTPKRRIWNRINAFRQRHFAGHRVVGVFAHGGRVAFGHFLQAINRDIKENGDGAWTPHKLTHLPGAAAAALDGEAAPVDELDTARAANTEFYLLRANRTKVFVVSRDHQSFRTILRGFGNEPQFVYYPHRNFSDVSDEGALIDVFLLALCDVVYAGPSYIDTLGTFFSKRPRIVQMQSHKKHALPDALCQPCISLAGVVKTRCYSPKMAIPEGPYKCEREYPIF
jgi:hypothetical protein